MMSRLLVEELPYPVAIVVRDKVNLSIAARRLVDALEEAFVRAAGALPACQRSQSVLTRRLRGGERTALASTSNVATPQAQNVQLDSGT